MRFKKISSMLTVAVAVVTLSRPANAQVEDAGPISRVELRELLIKLAERLDSRADGTDTAAILRQRIDAMDAQTFEHFYRFSNNWKKLSIALELMGPSIEPSDEKKSLQSARFAMENRDPVYISPAGLPADLFAVAYPTGSNYTTFRATLPGLGAMFDTPGSAPGLNDERCDANFEAGVAIAASTFAFANVVAETVCEALPELADIPCWVAQGVLQVAAEANNTVAAQCAIVDGAVDAAEIEAAFENGVAIYTNLDAHHTALNNHDLNLNIQATGIKAQLATHDADMKTLLASLQNAVDENTQRLKSAQAVQRAIIRLLLTPEGRRKVDPAVLTCTGDDCPAVLQCPGPECSFPIP